MKHPVRIIPRLDIKGPNLVKGVHLEGLRVLGKPEDFADYYYQSGADELLYMDIVASLYERNSLDDIISKTAKKVFIPLIVGGGLRSVEDIRRVLRAGADKVTLNTAAIRNPKIISEAANIFGSSTITVTIEAIAQADGTYQAFTDNGREYTGKEVVSWAKEIESLGAGEIIITSVDREGTGKGYENKLTALISKAVSIPVIASGGAGKIDDVTEVVKAAQVQAVAVASIFHYEFIQKNRVLEGYSEGNLDFLKSAEVPKHFAPTTIQELKMNLYHKGIACRYKQ